ncbi:endonuclease/exonuclease/phosphatase family protein [Streptomyces sp. NPDC059072]|uniref:endonuclease/exonuclease/phosphatase family protein n=1 Tax=unclassified Streptomyces TaxID=2593676 RepID=UPI0036936DE2
MTAKDDGRPARERPARERSAGRVLAALAVLTALLMLLADRIPNRLGNPGSFVQTFLPWSGIVVLGLAALALLRRSRLALVAVLVPALVWGLFHAGTLTDRADADRADTGDAGGALTVVTHNVDDENPDPAGTARALAATGAQLIALEELVEPAAGRYAEVLAGSYPYHEVRGTVGLWSTYPLADTRAVPIMEWTRALRTTAQTPQGPLTVYVAHLPSVRVRLGSGFDTARRNAAARRLAEAVRGGPGGRTLLMGDLNSTTGDRAVAPLMSQFRSAQDVAGAGFGFSWPAAFPVARIDQVLVRDLTPVSAWNLPATPSDHLPVAARLRL